MFVKNKRSRSIYISGVRLFVMTQIQYCDLLQSFSEEWVENGGIEDNNNIVRNANWYFQVLHKFCNEANENLKVVKPTDENSVGKIRVCTLFNENVICNPKFKRAVPFLRAQEEQLRLKSDCLASPVERKLIDLVMRSLAMLRKNLARINQIMVDANKFEAHESTIALIKLNRLLDTPLVQQEEEPSSYNVVANAFEVPVDPVHDTNLVSLKAARGGPDGIRAAVVAFSAVHRRLSRLNAAIGQIRNAVEHVGVENLRFAEMWYELLGHNAYEYAVSSFLDQCRRQRQSSQETGLKLAEMQTVLSDAETGLVGVLDLVGAGTSVMKELQSKNAAIAGENYRQRILHTASTGHSQVLELVAIVIRALIGAMHQWYGSILNGRNVAAAGEKGIQGHRDIVVDYYKCIMFTDALCVRYQKSKVKLFRDREAFSAREFSERDGEREFCERDGERDFSERDFSERQAFRGFQ